MFWGNKKQPRDVAKSKNSNGTMLYTCIPSTLVSFDPWPPLLLVSSGSLLEIRYAYRSTYVDVPTLWI